MDGIGVLVFRCDWSRERADVEIRQAAKAVAEAGFTVIDVTHPEFLDSLRRAVATLEGDEEIPDTPPPDW